jgi:hypothetical protein
VFEEDFSPKLLNIDISAPMGPDSYAEALGMLPGFCTYHWVRPFHEQGERWLDVRGVFFLLRNPVNWGFEWGQTAEGGLYSLSWFSPCA